MIKLVENNYESINPIEIQNPFEDGISQRDQNKIYDEDE